MATQQKTTNPLISKMRQDGVLGRPGEAGPGMANAMQSTFANLRAPLSPPPGQAMPQAPAVPMDNTPLPTGKEGLNVATGNIFNAGLPRTDVSGIQSLPVATQVAGVLSGLGDQGRMAQFQAALKYAGYNLDPNGQLPEDYQGAVAGAQNLYNQFFGSGGDRTPTRYESYAPTGLRDRVLAANGGLVFGQGNVMAGLDGKNAQGGNRFFLGQVTPMSADGRPPAPPPNPILGSTAAQANPSMASTVKAPDAYTQNAQAFKDHQVTQQMQAGILKALPPGYMLDPDRPGAIKAIPGGPAEQKLADADAKKAEANKSAIEKAGLVVGTIDKILPEIDRMTAGPAALITANTPGLKGYDIAKQIDTIKANIGFDQLQAMRAASHTGGALGSVAIQELNYLQSSLGSLDQSQSPKQLKDTLAQIKHHYDRWKRTTEGKMPDVSTALSPEKRARLQELRAKMGKK